jgi:hypothetical protein
MPSTFASYARRRFEEPKRALRLRRHEDRETLTPAGTGLSLLAVAAVAAIVVTGIYYGPDIMRYLKIRRM